MSKKRQKFCIQEVNPFQDGYEELTLAIVPKEQAERLEYLVQKIKAIQNDFERVLNTALMQGRDVTPEAYVWVNRKTLGFKNEYDGIMDSLEKGKRRTYLVRKGKYGKGSILDRLPADAMLIR